MFGRKKDRGKAEGNEPKQQYDPAQYRAVLRCSICNGEQVAGFRHLESGRFEEIMLIRGPQDLQAFREKYGVEQVTKEY